MPKLLILAPPPGFLDFQTALLGTLIIQLLPFDRKSNYTIQENETKVNKSPIYR